MQSPADVTRIVTPFIARRLNAIWRAPDTEYGPGDVWLEFCPRGEEPTLLRLTADRCRVTSWYGPSAWALRVELETTLPAEGLAPWFPFPVPEGGSVRDWALTEMWLSPVACNIHAPQGYWLQDVCGGLALHFSNAAGPNLYGRLLGARYEQHDMDAPHEYFVGDTLPPLVGSGLWQRMAYLKDDTPRDDEAMRHVDDDYRGPATLGCLKQFFDELYAFQDWFEKEPAFRAFRSEATLRWYKRHVDVLSDLSESLNYGDTSRGRYHREALSQDVAAYGLGTLFTDAWYERDAAAPEEPRVSIGAADLRAIRRRYAPLREAYRQWFRLQRQACLADQRLHHPQPEEPIPNWIWTLNAALTRGSLRFDELQGCLTSKILRDDFREPWAPDDEPGARRTWSAATSGPQDVLIEGDEERAGHLRVTWWPVSDRRDRVIVLRAERAALEDWWSCRRLQPMPSVLAQQQMTGRAVTETWPTLADIVARAAARHRVPPRVNIDDEKLPPYTCDDIRWVAHLRMQGQATERWPQVCATDPDLVWTFDSSHRRIPLLVGRDCHPLMSIDGWQKADERVIFPAVWPPEVLGDSFKPFYLMWSSHHWREERIEGRDYRPGNWLLPVQRWVPLTDDANHANDGDGPHGWCWGLIDIDGRFVLPCRYRAMGFPQGRGVGKPVQAERRPPPGREPWCWVWVGDEEHADGLLATDREPATGNVIEAWSGEPMNAADLVVRRLDHQFMVVCARSDLPKLEGGQPVAHGLANLATGKCGPQRWQRIDTFSLSVSHAAPAQCAQTGRWTYVDEHGEALLDPSFARAGQIDSGLAIVQQDNGAEPGTVGAFGPHGAASLGRWFVEPRWHDILGEYDGHFVVQDAAGRWAMVTPEGEAITPFVAREDREELNGDILHQVIEQFKRVQRRRFLGWLREARATGSLAVMAGKLRSSFGAYDYGALPLRDIAVRLTRDLPAAPEPYHDLPLVAGAEFAWRPGQRNYYGSIDLRTHTMIGPPSEYGGGYHGIAVPWDALALAAPPIAADADVHRATLDDLLAALGELSAALESDASASAREAERACRQLAMLGFHLAMFLVLGGEAHPEHVLAQLHCEIEGIDFPGRLNVIGADAAPKSAVAPWRPWPAAVQAPLDRAIGAYQAWLPLFKTAIAEHDNQGSIHA